MPSELLLVDNDSRRRRDLAARLEAAGHAVEGAASGPEALARLRAACAEGIALCVLDLDPPSAGELELLREARAEGIAIPVVALASDDSPARIVEAMRAGATDFVEKSAGARRLDGAIHDALAGSRMTGRVPRLAREGADRLTFDDLVAVSPATRQAVALARRAAQSDIPVLIEGESGTGKELFARAIHGESARAGAPFVVVNCGALPADLAESALFGHEPGAFSGAAARRPGRFRECAGGTLFLDGVGELRPETQARLLRALQTGEVDPVGGSEPVATDVRVISASDRDLRALTGQGAFRGDLFYRISVFPLRLPPLRERREDIPALARRFLRAGLARGAAAVEDFAPEAMDRLVESPWPGNVRELENAVERALVLSQGRLIEADDLQLPGAHGPPGGPVAGPSEAGARDLLVGPDGHIRPLRHIETEVIRTALRLYRGRMTEAARRLGIGRSTLYRKIEELQLGRNGSN